MSLRVAASTTGGVPAGAGLHLPELPVREDELALEDHEALRPASVDAPVEHAPSLHGSRTHEDRRGREAAVDGHRRPLPRLHPPWPGVDVHRLDLDALDQHQAFAIVVRSGLLTGVRPLHTCQRQVDRIVDVAFDDEEPGEAARHLIVRRAMTMRVIPVRARRMWLRRRAAAARAHHVAEGELVVGLADALVRFELAPASGCGRTLADVPIATRQHPQKGIVPVGTAGIPARIHMQAVGVKVGRVRSVRQVRRAGQAAGVDERDRNVRKELVEMVEHARRSRPIRQTVAPLSRRHCAKHALEVVGRDLERVGSGPLGHLPVIPVEHVAQLHAEHRVAAHANRGARAAPVEAEERREPVSCRHGARHVTVSHHLQGERLRRPIVGTPHPWLRPVLHRAGPGIRDVLEPGRLRRTRPLARPWLDGRARLAGGAEPEPHADAKLQQAPPAKKKAVRGLRLVLRHFFALQREPTLPCSR